MKRTNSCTTKKSFAEISIFLASKWFFISIFVVTILCYMTPVYYGDGVSEMSTLELLRLKANPSFAIEPIHLLKTILRQKMAIRHGDWRTCFAVWSNTFRIVLYRDGLLYLRHNYCR